MELAELKDKLSAWSTATSELAAAKAKELALRNEIFNACFPDPKEGANNLLIGGRLIVNGVYKLNRTIDKAALPAVLEQLGSGAEDRLIKYKPELVIKEYKALTEEQRRAFDVALTVTPGTPSLSVKEVTP